MSRILATKSPGQREDEETERLVRPSPKIKPPRHDRRREISRPEKDPDTDGDPDLKGDPDLSMNYKDIGGSVLEAREAIRSAIRMAKAEAQDDEFEAAVKGKSFRHPETGNKVEFNSLPVPEQERIRARFKAKSEKGKGNKSTKSGLPDPSSPLHELAKADERVQGFFKDVANPSSQIGSVAKANPDLPVGAVLKGFPGLKLPPEIKTLGNLVDALNGKVEPKKAPSKEKAPAPSEEAGVPSEPKVPSEPTETSVKPETPEISKEEAPKDPQESPKAPPAPEESKTPEGPKAKPPKKDAPKKGLERPNPTAKERRDATHLLTDTFPPEVAAQYIGLHPHDIHTLVASYREATEAGSNLSMGDLHKVLGGTYETDPDKVAAPKEYRGKPLSKMSPEAQEEAIQAHRMETVARSMAVKPAIAKALRKSGADPDISATLSVFLLKSPKDREHLLDQASEDVFTQAIEKGGSQPAHPAQRKRMLESVSKLDRSAGALMAAHYRAQDYQAARKEFLKGSGPNRIDEREPPEVIHKKLKKAEEFLTRQGEGYPTEASVDPAKIFRERVLNDLEARNPKKAKFVREQFNVELGKKYDEDHHKYQKDLHAFLDGKNPGQKMPRPPIPPQSHNGGDKRSGWMEWLSRHPEKNSQAGRVASLFVRYGAEIPKPFGTGGFLFSSYHRNLTMEGSVCSCGDTKCAGNCGCRHAVKQALYHGVEPYPKGHEGFAPYVGWSQAHQRDLGDSDYNELMKSAREWLRAPVLVHGVEGIVRDTQLRAALDLAIRDHQGGKYAAGVHPDIYNYMLAKLAGVSEDEVLVTVRASSTTPRSNLTSSTPQRESAMNFPKFAAEEASRLLGQLDRYASIIQQKHESMGMDFKAAKELVNKIDKFADELEAASYGEASFAARQAKVIQKEPDEAYMAAFENPMAPISTNGDEPYMAAYKDDQSSAVQSGKSTTGRPLAP